MELRAKQQNNSQENEAYLPYIFPPKSITAFLSLGTLDSTLALYLEITLNGKITNQKPRARESISLNGAQNKKAEHHLFCLNDEHVPCVTNYSPPCTCS